VIWYLSVIASQDIMSWISVLFPSTVVFDYLLSSRSPVTSLVCLTHVNTTHVSLHMCICHPSVVEDVVWGFIYTCLSGYDRMEKNNKEDRHRFPSIYQWQRFWFRGRVRRSSMPTTCTTRTRPHIALWLERPVHRHTGDLAGPEASVSLSLSREQATVHFWPATCTVSDDNSLRCAHTAEMMSRWHSIFYFAARHTRRHDHLPTTSIQLTLCRGCGPSWSQSGPWHAPLPRPGMREREEEEEKEGRKKEDEVTGRP